MERKDSSGVFDLREIWSRKSQNSLVNEARPYSNSSARLPILWKIHELASIVSEYAADAIKGDKLPSAFRFSDEYDRLLRRYCNRPLKNAKVFEIGFGARPGVMIALVSLGVDAYGVDLDVPLLNGTLRELKAMYRKNGTERALKSCVRFFVFDWIWRRRLRKELKQRGHDLVMPENRLLLQDAASVDWPEHSLDMICSESVFEHIPRESLETLLQKMAHWLKPNGLALIRPDVFTGISGGHMLEWFDLGENRKRRSEPWEHLRQKRYRGNVYLNELTRADLRKLFSQRFEILEENVVDPNQGRQFYTPEIAEELKHYGEDELFSNGVQFVLRPKIPS
jgi:SAM-dependent methyltransferase